MNAKSMSIDIMPAMRPAIGRPRVEETSARVRLVLFERPAANAGACRGVVSRAPQPGLAEGWETLSFLTLWICGWTGVVLSLL